MDIGSGNGYPESALSNFAPHPFVFRGFEVASMEGLLQALKCKSPAMQLHVMTLVGKAAKFAGKKRKWWRDQTLHWQGRTIDRHGEEYQLLLDEAFEALFQNAGARRALLASGNAVLKHSMGKTDEKRTVLTCREFCSRLTKIRTRLQAEERK